MFIGVNMLLFVFVRVSLSLLVLVAVALLVGLTVLVIVSPATVTLVLLDVALLEIENDGVEDVAELTNKRDPRSRPPKARSRKRLARRNGAAPKMDVKSSVANWRLVEGKTAKVLLHKFCLQVI